MYVGQINYIPNATLWTRCELILKSISWVKTVFSFCGFGKIIDIVLKRVKMS